MALDLFLPADFSQTFAQTVKGLLFVTAATVLVFWLSRRAFARVALEARIGQTNKTERLLKTVMANLGEAVILVGPPKRSIVDCNSAVKSMLGYSAEELVGKSTALIHEDETAFESFGTTCETVLQKEGISRCEYRLKHKDGSWVLTEIHVSGVFENNATPVAIQGTTRDIRQRRALEVKLRQSMKLQAIGTFAGGIAHEINNPIMGISAYSELIADAGNPSPEIREYCSEIQKQTERVHILIKDLLGYARADVDQLLDLGKQHVYVACLNGEIHENDAAQRIAPAAGRRTRDPHRYYPNGTRRILFIL